jgi:uncharacterized short protein YbdD (DUF466 family)
MLFRERIDLQAATIAKIGRDMAKTARLMVGVPDYDAYVAHRKREHPGEPIMSYEDFFRERQASRYGVNGGKISRCC